MSIIDFKGLLNNGHDDVINLIFEKNLMNGIDLSQVDPNARMAIIKPMIENDLVKNIPFSKLVEDERFDVIKLMLKKKLVTNLEETFDLGRTLLMIAAKNSDVEFAKLLVKGGANINAVSESKCTPLRFATSSKNESMVQLLIDNGADLNLADIGGNTPLIIAVYFQSNRIAEMLIEAGADLNPKDNMGADALYYAKERNIAMVNVIEDAINRRKSSNLVCKDVDGKTYPILVTKYIAKAVFRVNETEDVPEISTFSINDDTITVKLWDTNNWVPYKLANGKCYDIQLPVKYTPLDYHVVEIDGTERYVQFPANLKLVNQVNPMGLMYRC